MARFARADLVEAGLVSNWLESGNPTRHTIDMVNMAQEPPANTLSGGVLSLDRE